MFFLISNGIVFFQLFIWLFHFLLQVSACQLVFSLFLGDGLVIPPPPLQPTPDSILCAYLMLSHCTLYFSTQHWNHNCWIIYLCLSLNWKRQTAGLLLSWPLNLTEHSIWNIKYSQGVWKKKNENLLPNSFLSSRTSSH